MTSSTDARAVVVGVSPNTGSRGALRRAAAEATERGVPLRAVLAWNTSTDDSDVSRASNAPSGAEAAAAESLRGFVMGALGPDPAGVELAVVQGTAVTALLSAGDDAQLLVIGPPGAGDPASTDSTPIADQLEAGARCPVVVVSGSDVP